MNALHRRGPVAWLVLAGLLVLLLALVGPFLIVALNSVKSPEDYSSNGPLALPVEIHLDGIRALWGRIDYPRKLWNSLVISLTVSVLAVTISVFNAYALGIGRVRGRYFLIAVFLLANTLPQEALVYPLYYAAKEVGLYNTRLMVIIIFVAIQSAFGTYLLSSALSAFPTELLEAARIDGASRFQILWRVVVPIVRPMLMVLFVFFFIWTWNEFFIPFVFLISNDVQTLPVALGVLQGQRMVDATAQSASALLGMVPALIFFLLFQRSLVKGVVAGAVK
ncbi:MAG: carbohydrate ABC transporter permease [Acidimicrobiales bacterium]